MPLLSVCIPTYNRANILEYCLENLKALDDLDIDYEIVVVDHASTDHTQDVLKKNAGEKNNFRYYTQTRQVGIERQLCSAFQMARGTYSVYIADDDKIVPEQLVKYVRYMDANAGVSALYAPWLAYDDAEGKIIHGYYGVPERKTFTAEDPIAMLNFISEQTIFPECGIYKTDHLRSILFGRTGGPYQAFLAAYSLLRQGHVVFETEPFYLEVAVAKPEFAIAKRMNVDINLTYLDNIRAGMEMMVARLMMDYGHEKLPDQFRANIHEILLNYNNSRLMVAFRRMLHARQFIEAVECAQRVMLWSGRFDQQLLEVSHQIYLPTALQAAVELFNGKSWLKHFYLYGFSRPQELINVFKEKLPDIFISAAAKEKIIAHENKDEVFILVKQKADRQQFDDFPLLQNNMISIEELAQYHQLIPAKRHIGDI